ncbi:hypothetical protein AVEN_225700-1 [Araneus ventricosus]|uniref:Uncharacterized protein n=1 Tax=Araneus ventricosus TaxID=182803 RepID=A0A4Y2FTX2_ARAVE|nr:hypothetical protein AVEN_225700-1 [Araneus ventricosus]
MPICGPTYPRRVQGWERASGERAAPPACGGRDLLTTIKLYRHCPNRGSTFKYMDAGSINMVRESLEGVLAQVFHWSSDRGTNLRVRLRNAPVLLQNGTLI